ncbi:unnamed protein product, partial [Thlaspi arvense]
MEATKRPVARVSTGTVKAAAKTNTQFALGGGGDSKQTRQFISFTCQNSKGNRPTSYSDGYAHFPSLKIREKTPYSLFQFQFLQRFTSSILEKKLNDVMKMFIVQIRPSNAMEQRNLLLSALSVGVGVGLGLASGQAVSKWAGYNFSGEGVNAEQIEQELLRLVVEGKEGEVTFDEFPYYLSEQTRVLLTSAAYVHLKNVDVSRHTGYIAFRAAELYQQRLAKALAHHFEAKLLLLDVTDFSLKCKAEHFLILGLFYQSLKRSISETTLGRMSSCLVPSQFCPQGSKTEFVWSSKDRWSRRKTVHVSSIEKRFDIRRRKTSCKFFPFSAPSIPFVLEGRFCEESKLYKGEWLAHHTGKVVGFESCTDLAKPRRSASTSSNMSSISSESSSPHSVGRHSLSGKSSKTLTPMFMGHKSAQLLSSARAAGLLMRDFSYSHFQAYLRRYSPAGPLQVLVSLSETSSIILYIRDVERVLLKSHSLYKLFDRVLKKLSGPVLILGSQILDSEGDYCELDERLSLLFPYNIEIEPPEDEIHQARWKAQLEDDMKVLAANDIVCDDLGTIYQADTMVLSNYIEEIVVSAISYHLMNNKDPEYRNGKLVISSDSLCHGFSIFQERKKGGKMCSNWRLMPNLQEWKKHSSNKKVDGLKPDAKSEFLPSKENKDETEKTLPCSKKDGESLHPKVPSKTKTLLPQRIQALAISSTLVNNMVSQQEVPPDNEYEKRIRSEVIAANEIGVTFADIGALDEVKESLQELVMLPLRRPELFKALQRHIAFWASRHWENNAGKAIANEAGASFINVSMSTITSKWFGEDEKNVRALFTLAAKVSPTIIFVDEVDSMLGQRTRVGEHEAMRKIKNEFMSHWDGLLSKQGERILVLAATNRPFDLDEAIIRRFECRIMVGLPSVESREMILKTLLAKEKVENLDFKELAAMTEGYSGSDLKNLCTTAAYRPVRELIQQERLKEREKKAEEGKSVEDASNTKEENKEERAITLRPLNMEDMRHARNQ